MSARGYQTGYVGNIHHEDCTHFIRNGPGAAKVYDPGIRGGSRNYDLGPVLLGQSFHLIVIYKLVSRVTP